MPNCLLRPGPLQQAGQSADGLLALLWRQIPAIWTLAGLHMTVRQQNKRASLNRHALTSGILDISLHKVEFTQSLPVYLLVSCYQKSC